MGRRVFKDPVLSVMLHSVIVFVCTGARLLLFSGILLFSRQALNCPWKEIITSRASGLFKLAILKYVLKCCLINKVHE